MEGHQLEMFNDGFGSVYVPNVKTGKELRDEGIKKAVDHAEEVCENWSEKAYRFLRAYLKPGREFQTEDIRSASEGVVPEPPSRRAWGGVILRAAKSGLIIKIGHGTVDNPRAHKCFSAKWRCVC